MKKIISIVIASFLFSVTANAGGMVGAKIGFGEIEGTKNAYTAGSTDYAADSEEVTSGYGALFAEINVMDSPVSVGVEYIPFDAVISIDNSAADSSVELSDHTTLYALASADVADGVAVFAKLGYSHADIKAKANHHTTTINSSSGDLEGPMFGAGVQIGTDGGFIARVEAAYTEYDDVNVNTTSNGSASVAKKAEVETTTISLSIAKSF